MPPTKRLLTHMGVPRGELVVNTRVLFGSSMSAQGLLGSTARTGSAVSWGGDGGGGGAGACFVTGSSPKSRINASKLRGSSGGGGGAGDFGVCRCGAAGCAPLLAAQRLHRPSGVSRGW